MIHLTRPLSYAVSLSSRDVPGSIVGVSDLNVPNRNTLVGRLLRRPIANTVLSKCLDKDDIAPHTVTCEIAVFKVCGGKITESGFITEDDTSPVCHTPSCPKNPVDTAYDVGSVVPWPSAPQATSVNLFLLMHWM
ncbi:hypothetical protein TNCV_1022181 [Trichonephila clavipes]|nr:hypothetical protein TNCV_1022181 [Trichonephila clavipes]